MRKLEKMANTSWEAYCEASNVILYIHVHFSAFSKSSFSKPFLPFLCFVARADLDRNDGAGVLGKVC